MPTTYGAEIEQDKRDPKLRHILKTILCKAYFGMRGKDFVRHCMARLPCGLDANRHVGFRSRISAVHAQCTVRQELQSALQDDTNALDERDVFELIADANEPVVIYSSDEDDRFNNDDDECDYDDEEYDYGSFYD